MSARYETRGFHALAHEFRIVADSEAVGRHLELIFAGLPECPAPADEYVLATIDDQSRCGFELSHAGEVVATGSEVASIASTFVHHVNRMAIDADYAVMCHAGAVELDGVGLVFPAHMESGKTTLTAGLVRAGFAYLTDEAVAFRGDDRWIEPYPKPLSIDAGSHHLFPELEPLPAPGDERASSDQWQVPPDAIRPGAVGAPCRARFVVFPRYERDAATELVPISRAAGLLELATNTFHFRDHARRSLDVLTGVIEDAVCFRLTVGSLREACALIVELAGAPEAIRG